MKKEIPEGMKLMMFHPVGQRSRIVLTTKVEGSDFIWIVRNSSTARAGFHPDMFTDVDSFDNAKAIHFPVRDWSQVKPAEFKFMGKWIYNWFSNFNPSSMMIDGKEWPSVENYYQAMKTTNPTLQEAIRLVPPSESKKLGKKLTIRPDWEEIKVQVMLTALKAKWSLPEWKQKLLSTNDEVIVEWNNWGDRIWGATDKDCKGQNILGCLLMQIREELKADETKPTD